MSVLPPLPDVRYGDAHQSELDWRKHRDVVDDADDDEELTETPADVVALLGFDPLTGDTHEADS